MILNIKPTIHTLINEGDQTTRVGHRVTGAAMPNTLYIPSKNRVRMPMTDWRTMTLILIKLVVRLLSIRALQAFPAELRSPVKALHPHLFTTRTMSLRCMTFPLSPGTPPA